MPNDTPYKLTQGYEVLSPKSGQAYPILCDEWDFLKEKINDLSYQLNIYMECGFALIGIALSTFVAIITGAISSPNTSQSTTNLLIVAWAVVIVSMLVGALCIIFAFEKEKIKKQKASEILSQMEIIEKRYEMIPK